MKYLTLTAFIFFWCAGIGHAQTWMPDPNLRQAVRDALALPADTPLTKEMMLSLESINAQNVGIVDIRGLEFAQNLAYLNLGSNDIQDASPVRNLTRLWGLSLYANNVSNVSPLSALTNLEYLNLAHNPVHDASPLAPLTQLTTLDLFDCRVSDVRPLTSLKNLQVFILGHNPIRDLEPLASFTQLTTLNLFNCQVSDVRPLAGLKNLQVLILTSNRITDFSPLAALTDLQELYIKGNLGTDISSLQDLTLTEFEYDVVCDIAPLGPSITSRMETRNFPSVFQAWDHLIADESRGWEYLVTEHDLYWSPFFDVWWDTSPAEPTYGLSTQLAGDLEGSKAKRQGWLNRNPNMLFLVEVRIHNHLQASAFPADSEFWLRDKNNQAITSDFNEHPMDLLNPHLQDLLTKRIVAVASCGLFDGVMIDGFNSNGTGFVDRHYHTATDAEIIAATTRILREVRRQVPDDFLIVVNANRTKPTAYTEYVNGTFMETEISDADSSYTRERLQQIEDTLLWAETHLREPQINCLEGEGIGTSPPDSVENRRWMRAFTTLSLTHSNGYVLYTDGQRSVDPEAPHHAHIWFDFWDADLGQPIGETAQRYENRDGLFIREFTNGWAVYNRSGTPQAVRLPEPATGVESGLRNRLHIIPDLDGEIYLKRATDSPDVNGDGVVNVQDLVAVANGFGKSTPDVNGDGVVNIQDLVAVVNRFGQ